MGRPPKKISDFDVRLGAVVRSKRSKVGLSRDALAAATGISEANLKRREGGLNEITVSELRRIAEAVGVPAWEMVDEALADFGGIGKLLAEHKPMSHGVISMDEHRKKGPLTEESARGQAHAANYDAEHEEETD